MAVLALMVREVRLSVVKEGGESEEQAWKRAVGVVNDCDLQLIVRMRDADRLKLRCERRV